VCSLCLPCLGMVGLALLLPLDHLAVLHHIRFKQKACCRITVLLLLLSTLLLLLQMQTFLLTLLSWELLLWGQRNQLAAALRACAGGAQSRRTALF